jgi:hypothetical protein
MTPRKTALALLGALLVVTAACGDDGEDTATTTTAGDTTTTPADSSSTTSAKPTTTTAAAPTTTGASAGELGQAPTYHDDKASGSGCTPGSGDTLPNGWWYGTVTGAVDEEVTFDLACYYVGPAAEAEAASRGDEVNNDYYVVNDNPALRDVAVAPDAQAQCVEVEDALHAVDCAPGDVDGEWAVWLRVVDGHIDRLVEQFAP